MQPRNLDQIKMERRTQNWSQTWKSNKQPKSNSSAAYTQTHKNLRALINEMTLAAYNSQCFMTPFTCWFKAIWRIMVISSKILFPINMLFWVKNAPLLLALTLISWTSLVLLPILTLNCLLFSTMLEMRALVASRVLSMNTPPLATSSMVLS